MGPSMRIQAPPNLVSAAECAALVARRRRRLGRDSPVTPDHVNPERPMAGPRGSSRIDHRRHGFTLTERIAAQPTNVLAGQPWIDPGSPRTSAPWQIRRPASPPTSGRRADRGRSPTRTGSRSDVWTSTPEIDTDGRATDTRSDLNSAFGDWDTRPGTGAGPGDSAAPERVDSDVATALRHAERDPAGCSDADYLAWRPPTVPGLDALASLADSLRREAVETMSPTSSTEHQLHQHLLQPAADSAPSRSARATPMRHPLRIGGGRPCLGGPRAGATEVCMQGGIDPGAAGDGYADLVRAVKERVPSDARARVLADGDRQRRVPRWRRCARVASPRCGRRPRHHPPVPPRSPRRRGPLGPHQGKLPTAT